MLNRMYDVLHVNICANELQKHFELKNLLYSKVVGFEILDIF